MNSNHDSLILKVFTNKCNEFNSNRVRKIINYSNIKHYLDNRFEYISSYTEALNRIKYHIEIRPICPVCGNRVKYRKKNLFQKTCSNSCGFINSKNQRIKTCLNKYGVDCVSKSKKVQDKIKETCLERYGVTNGGASKEAQEKIKQTTLNNYGVEYPMQSPIVREKSKETCLNKYGVEYPMQSPIVREKSKETCFNKYGVDCVSKSKKVQYKIKETCLERYGVTNGGASKEAKEKIHTTVKERYGVENVLQLENVRQKCKETCIKKYGVDNYSKTKEWKEYASSISEEVQYKGYLTKKKNNSFNISKPEEELYLYMKEKFPDVKRQYKDKERYPYFCDFYIPKLDYFIELNGTWLHGGHPFDCNNTEDISILESWKKKYNNGEHPMYANAINTWTISDVKKRETAKVNNLDYKEVWTLEEGKKFIDKIWKK